jgi:uncharacterized protein (DUF885 family)
MDAMPADGHVTGTETGHAADALLTAFLDAEWTHALERSPEFASNQGDRSGDDRWDDVSLAARAAELDHAREAYKRLEQIDRAALSAPAQLNYDLYAQQLRDALRGFELQTFLFALNQRDGVQNDSTIFELLPFTSMRDFEALIARLQSWPRKVDQTIDVLREAIRRKRLWPRVVMARVPAQLDRLSVAPENHPFFAPFKTLPAWIGAGDAARLRAAARSAITQHIDVLEARVDTWLSAA